MAIDLVLAALASSLALAGHTQDASSLKNGGFDEKAKLETPFAGPKGADQVATVVNVEGVKDGRLKLTAQVLADIYLGNITRWDAPQIASLNPGVALPHQAITVVHRSDPSPASQTFTGFLAANSASFRSEVGASASAAFPVGVGRSGDAGVADVVAKTPDSIGYVDWGFAKTSGLSTARLIDGKTLPVRAFSAPAPSAPPLVDSKKSTDLFNPR
jgi:ABC-type phosphate transport system substrate-binding protein